VSASLDLKSTRLNALLLPLRSRQADGVLASAQAQWGGLRQAFEGEPLVLDLRELPLEGPPVDWALLLAGLRQLGLQPVALAGAERLDEGEQQAARQAGLQLGEAGSERPAPPSPAPAPAAAAPAGPRCLVIDRPSRA
jgi:septum formation inhibitor MinC